MWIYYVYVDKKRRKICERGITAERKKKGCVSQLPKCQKK